MTEEEKDVTGAETNFVGQTCGTKCCRDNIILFRINAIQSANIEKQKFRLMNVAVFIQGHVDIFLLVRVKKRLKPLSSFAFSFGQQFSPFEGKGEKWPQLFKKGKKTKTPLRKERERGITFSHLSELRWRRGNEVWAAKDEGEKNIEKQQSGCCIFPPGRRQTLDAFFEACAKRELS